jgi:ParB-like chromosome segregation protein Spo0J
MEAHKYAELFPKMEAEQFDELVESIRKNGLREKIVTLDGKILDGLNRAAACEVAGEKPQFVKFQGKKADALDYVVDKNLNRRQLTSAQRSMIAAEIATSRNSETTTEEAAKKMGVSRDSVQIAKKVKAKSKKLAKEVKSGKKSLAKAEREIEPKKKQTERPALDFTDVYTGKTKKDDRSLGEICFTAFSKAMKVEDSDWGGLPENERKAWQSASEAVKSKI